MSDNARPPTTVAQPPFDDANADVVFHTSDHVDFRIFRLILTLSSPLFQGMFALPQPPDANSPEANKPPSIDVPEDSQTLDTLLRFLYPNTHVPSFRDLLHARNVAIAASKYHTAAALDKIASAVQTQYVASHPLHVYFIACRMGWEDVARAAAGYCLDPARMPGEELACDDLLYYPGAGVAYHRLETYRNACRRALEKKMDDMALFDDEDEDGSCDRSSEDSGDESAGERGGISGDCLGRWKSQYLANIRLAVSKCPRQEALDDYSLTPDGNCSRCDTDRAHTIAIARLEVASQIENVLSEVKLRFGS